MIIRCGSVYCTCLYMPVAKPCLLIAHIITGVYSRLLPRYMGPHWPTSCSLETSLNVRVLWCINLKKGSAFLKNQGHWGSKYIVYTYLHMNSRRCMCCWASLPQPIVLVILSTSCVRRDHPTVIPDTQRFMLHSRSSLGDTLRSWWILMWLFGGTMLARGRSSDTYRLESQ